MKQVIDPKQTTRADAFELWMGSPVSSTDFKKQ